MKAEKFIEVLSSYTFNNITNEKVIQKAIESILVRNKCSFEREYRLARSSILDFFFKENGLGVEVKVDGSSPSVVRQLHRYAGFGEVKELILVTTRHKHVAGLPYSMSDKPLYVHVIRNW